MSKKLGLSIRKKTKYFLEKNIFFVAPGSLEIPNNRGGAIEQNIFFLAQYSPIPAIVFSPRRGKLRTLVMKNRTTQSCIQYSIFQAVKNYPSPSNSFISKVISIFNKVPFYLEALARILIFSKKIDIVIVFDKFIGLLPLFFGRILGKKTLYMEYNIWPWCYPSTYRSTVFWVHIAFWKVLCRLVSAITVNSPSIKKGMIAFGMESSRVFVVPTGIEIRHLSERKNRKSEKFIVLYVGRLVEERGADLLPMIITAVLKNKKNMLFKIVGGGPLFERIEALVKEHRLEENVELLGQKSRREAIDLMKHSDVAIFISKNENYGSLALLECMAVGCPVIATNVGSTKELIRNGINSILVDPEPYLIAEAILNLSENKNLVEKIGQEGAVTAKEYSWEQVVHKFVNVLKKAKQIDKRSVSLQGGKKF
jgi:glycosyltransferase involved in cell wall biosynthesis